MRIRALSALAILALTATLAKGAATVGWIELKGELLDQPDPMAWLAGPDAPPTVRDVVTALHAAADRSGMKGVVIRLRETTLTTAQIEEIGAAMRRARDAGKRIHVFTEIYGPSELLLGSFADDVVLQAGGAVSFPGLYMEEMFLADTLAWVGLKADYV